MRPDEHSNESINEVKEMREQMRHLSDKELIQLLTVEAGDYTREALMAAQEEAQDRKLQIPALNLQEEVPITKEDVTSAKTSEERIPFDLVMKLQQPEEDIQETEDVEEESPVPNESLVEETTMWTCNVCSHEIEDEEMFCYHCGCTRELNPEDAARVREKRNAKDVKCVRCKSSMRYGGLKKFHEGSSSLGFWLGLGDIASLEYYDVYLCPRCGKIELFVDGIGEEYRREHE